jgi:hypothetical protein
MKIIFVSAILALSLTAYAQNAPPPSEATGTQIAAVPADTAAVGSRRALLVGIDTSPSTSPVLREMKDVAKRLAEVAPEGAQVGVVGFDSQAVKRLFADRTEAMNFIDSLSCGGKYSDLDRGVDGGLALLQEASATKAAAVFLTDGRVELPRKFRDKSDFVQILKREFTARPNVRVFVINVRGGKLAGLETLPQNVTVLSLTNWRDAAAEIEKGLAQQIKEQLAPPPTPVRAVTKEMPGIMKAERGSSTGLILVGVAAFALVTLTVIVLRRRRKGSSVTSSPLREDALRAEDLEPQRSAQPAREAVMILEFMNVAMPARGALPLRHVLRRGEKVLVGGSAFASGVGLPGLKQSRTVELAFDGEFLTCVRLRPDRHGEVDPVSLNRVDAPVTFPVGPADDLLVGDYAVRTMYADEESLALVDAFMGNRAGTVSSPTAAGRRVRRGSLRS